LSDRAGSACFTRLHSLTVADVPADVRAEFYQIYGENLPSNSLVFDLLEADDAKKFSNKA
jgi:hypothetical protein